MQHVQSLFSSVFFFHFSPKTQELNFNQECLKPPASSNFYRADQPRYAYVANLCVAKHARRQGIATNMLLLAIDAAVSYGKTQPSIQCFYAKRCI